MKTKSKIFFKVSLFIKNIFTKLLPECNLVASFIYYLKVLHGTRWHPFPEVLRLKWKMSSHSPSIYTLHPCVLMIDPMYMKQGFQSPQKHTDVACCYTGPESFSSDTRQLLRVSCFVIIWNCINAVGVNQRAKSLLCHQILWVQSPTVPWSYAEQLCQPCGQGSKQSGENTIVENIGLSSHKCVL